ncbi:MAG TPA: DMT family transporter [Microbacteriaceae bacterium]|nr:DMT family transporter [Microbacteriaceae bacterium]
MNSAARSASPARWLLVPLGILAGACMTLQARVNSALTAFTHDAALSATFSFAGGWLALALAMALQPRARQRLRDGFSAVARGTFPWWLGLGGLSGAFYVFTQGAAVPAVGIAIFTIAYVAAQTAGSFLWDHIGLGPSGPHQLSVNRVAGALLAVVAVTVAVSSAHAVTPTASWVVLLPVIAGIGASWQQAANGRVRVELGSVLATTFWNFTVGTAALLVASGVRAVSMPWHIAPGSEWWMWCGGPIGIVFIATAAAIVRRVGVLLLSLLLTLGQLSSALVITALTPSLPPVELGSVLGTAICIAAVAVMLIPSRAKLRHLVERNRDGNAGVERLGRR